MFFKKIILNTFSEYFADVELTDSRLLKLSQLLTDEVDLGFLAAQLGISDHVSRKHVVNRRADITEAAYDLLQIWRNRQSNTREAYKRLTEALEEAGQAYYIHAALKGHSATDTDPRNPDQAHTQDSRHTDDKSTTSEIEKPG